MSFDEQQPGRPPGIDCPNCFFFLEGYTYDQDFICPACLFQYTSGNTSSQPSPESLQEVDNG